MMQGKLSSVLNCHDKDPQHALLQVLCRNSGSTLGYGFATLMEEDGDSSSEEDEPLRPLSLTGATP